MTKLILAIFLAPLSLMAAKPPPPPQGAFNFNYNVGSVSNYHAYGMAGQIGVIAQPSGTIALAYWWVWDLGHVTDSGSITCPKPVAQKHSTLVGALFFADIHDVGASGFQNPCAEVVVQSSSTTIQIINPPPDSGLILYNGAFPGGYDLSAYVWDVRPIRPDITSQPSGEFVHVGDAASFTVVATGIAPLSYRWYFNGVPLTDNSHYSGSTTSTLSVNNVQVPDVGNYVVVVTDADGNSTTSQSAVLSVVL